MDDDSGDTGRDPVGDETEQIDGAGRDWVATRQAARRSARADRRGRADAADALVESHLQLVERVVAQVSVRFPRHVDREELVRAGTVGLVEAARRYDGAREIPFERFAARRIRGAVLDAVRSTDWAPRSVRAQARSVDLAEHELSSRLRRAPTTGETAAHLGVDERDLDRVRERVLRAALLGLDLPVRGDDGGSSTLGEALVDTSGSEPSEELERRELHSFVRHAVAHLPDRHRAVVIGYFVEQRSSEDIARSLDVTVSRVSQLRSEALAAMRRGIEAQFEDPGQGAATGSLVERRRAAYAAAIRDAAPCSERITDPGEAVTDEQFLAIVAAF